jgi:hypothetical protein
VIYEEYFSAVLESRLAALDESEVARAIAAFATQMESSELGQIAAGHFDLGAFVLDHLLGIKLPTSEFAFRLHRIS